MTKSVSEILDLVVKAKSVDEKVNVLKQYETDSLKIILKCMYDEVIEPMVPTETPKYTPDEHPDNRGALIKQARKLGYVFRDAKSKVPLLGPDLQYFKREHTFMTMLESVDKQDSLLLMRVIRRDKIKGLTKKTINKAFPGLIQK